MNLDDFLNFSLFGNSGMEYLTAFGVFLALLLVFKLIQMIVLSELEKEAKKTTTSIDDLFLRLVRHIRPPFYFFLAFYIALRYLNLSEFVYRIAYNVFVIVVVVQAILILQKVLDYAIRTKIAEKSGKLGKDKETIASVFGQTSKGLLWVVGGLLILSNLGVNITSLITGLGIGGVAIALAVQSVLRDIFASLSILVDRPFQTGDCILIGQDMGIVEKIGIKTTRLRTFKGNELIVSNQDLTNARVYNYKNLKSRRLVFLLVVPYDTKLEKLKKIPDIVAKVFSGIKGVSLEKVYFKEYKDSNLSYEIVYEIKSQDMDVHLELQEKVNYALLEAFNKESVSYNSYIENSFK